MVDLSLLLNELAKDKNQQRIVFSINNKKISAFQWLCDIYFIKKQLLSTLKKTQTKIAIWFDCPYEFSLYFFALILTKKIPVLLPNAQKGTLDLFKVHYDHSIVNQQIKINDNNLDKDDFRIEQTSEIIFFTSGSSGIPKKIIRNINHLNTELSVLSKTLNLTTHFSHQSKMISSVSHQHMYGFIFAFCLGLTSKKEIVLPLIEYPERLNQINNLDDTIFISSPSFLSRMVQLIELKDKTQLTIISAGSLLKKPLALDLTSLLINEPLEIYGSTETGVIGFRRQLSNSLWQLFDEVNFKIDNEKYCVFSSFFQSGLDDGFLLDDQIILDKNHRFFQLMGRLDRIVKLEGKRLSLDELEEKLMQFEFIEESYSLLLNNQRELIGSVIVLNKNGQHFLEKNGKLKLNKAIQQYLNQYFEKTLLPKRFRYVDEIRKNAQSKVILKEIKNLF